MSILYIDTETTGLNPYKDKVVLVGWAVDDSRVSVIEDFTLGIGEFKDNLVVGHNINFDLLFCHYALIHFVNCEYFDTQIYWHMIEPNQSSRLKDLGERLLGRKAVRISDFIQPKEKKGWVKIGYNTEKGFGYADPLVLKDYLKQDVELTRDLYKLAVKNGIPHYYKEIEQPLIKIIFDMEKRGMNVDLNKANKLLETFKKEQILLEGYFTNLGVNTRSPKQVSKFIV